MPGLLDGVKVLDLTHYIAGPYCTKLLSGLGADVIKVERLGAGDGMRWLGPFSSGAVVITGDSAPEDGAWFLYLNTAKQSLALDLKSSRGRRVILELAAKADILVENFAPGALARMGFGWERIQELNPRMIMASVKGFGPGPYDDCKVYENVAQCAGGSASTTGFRDGLPMVTGAQIGDSGSGLNLGFGILAALLHREKTGRGQRVLAAMQDGVINLCRVKLRDQQRLKAGPLKEYSQHGENVPFGEATPRAGNDSGGGQPGRILKCKGWETDPDAYTYFITQAAVWKNICDVIGKPDWKENPDYATPLARLPHLNEVFCAIEDWTVTKTKFEVMEICNPLNIPVGPILSMKELAEEPSLRATGTIVECEHPERGPYLSVGCPVKLSDNDVTVTRSPLLGEHTDEVLSNVLGYNEEDIATFKEAGAV